MASKAFVILLLNLVFFTLVSSSYVPNPTPSYPPPPPPPSNPGYPGGSSTTPAPALVGHKCPKDTLKIGACASVLRGNVAHAVIGPTRVQCCSLIDGLVGLDAAVCLCTSLKADLLGVVHLNLSVSLNLLLNFCGEAGVASDFKCPGY